MQWITGIKRKGNKWFVIILLQRFYLWILLGIHAEQEKEPYHTWNLLSKLLLKTAIEYKQKHNSPMVLVLDQIDRIAKKDAEFLGMLQDFAKDCADKGILIVVFVASESLVTSLMRSKNIVKLENMIKLFLHFHLFNIYSSLILVTRWYFLRSWWYFRWWCYKISSSFWY